MRGRWRSAERWGLLRSLSGRHFECRTHSRRTHPTSSPVAPSAPSRLRRVSDDVGGHGRLRGWIVDVRRAVSQPISRDGAVPCSVVICHGPVALDVPFAVGMFRNPNSICPMPASKSTLIPACCAATCAAFPNDVACSAASAEPAGALILAPEAPGSCSVMPPPEPPTPAPEAPGAGAKLGAPRSWNSGTICGGMPCPLTRLRSAAPAPHSLQCPSPHTALVPSPRQVIPKLRRRARLRCHAVAFRKDREPHPFMDGPPLQPEVSGNRGDLAPRRKPSGPLRRASTAQDAGQRGARACGAPPSSAPFVPRPAASALPPRIGCSKRESWRSITSRRFWIR